MFLNGASTPWRSNFVTEYSMTAQALAVALEEWGFDSVWAPEHSHISVSRKTPFPGGGELKLATGVLLVLQRDTNPDRKARGLKWRTTGQYLKAVSNGCVRGSRR